MKSNNLSNTIVACVLFGVLGTSAFADDKTIGDSGTNWQDHIVSTKTRAQVVDELKASGAQGRLVQDGSFEYSYPPAVTSNNGRGRAEVRAEAVSTTRTVRDFTTDLYFGG